MLQSGMVSTVRASIGSAIRSARLDRGWTQADLGAAASASRSMVAAIELGARDASLEALQRVAQALDGELVVELRAPLVVGRSDQRDAAHATCVAAVRRWLMRHGYECLVERPIVDGRIRGWIDVLGFRHDSSRLLVVEIKTELRDLGGLQRQVGWYARDARGAVAALGWRSREVVVLVAFLATAENDAQMATQREAITGSFPVRGRALDRALGGGPYPGWGLTMIDPRRRGGRLWMGLRLDGRRSEAPYASYADFMRTIGRPRGAIRPPR